MGTLQNVVDRDQTPHSPFAASSGKRRKIKTVRRLVNQQTAAAESGQDQQLVERAMAGDSAAQSRLFATHTPRRYRAAFSLLRNKADAEVAVQDCWYSAYSHFHMFEGRSSLSTWLTRIVINSALIIRRGNKCRSRISLDEVLVHEGTLQHYFVDKRRNPAEAYEATEMNQLLVSQIRELPSLVRTAFLLRDVDELSTSESMKRLGVNKSALKTRVLRARRRLTQKMRELLRADRKTNHSFTTEGRSVANRFG